MKQTIVITRDELAEIITSVLQSNNHDGIQSVVFRQTDSAIEFVDIEAVVHLDGPTISVRCKPDGMSLSEMRSEQLKRMRESQMQIMDQFANPENQSPEDS